jgi:hypothetical protein
LNPPPDDVRLCSSPAYPNQAFRARRAYGVQFHIEVSPDMAREWADVPEYAASLERVLGPGALERLIAQLEVEGEPMADHATGLFARWLDHVVEPRASRAESASPGAR